MQLNILELSRFPDTGATSCTAADYCELFAAEMNSLYLLAFLLTADGDKAEQCFVAALGECVEDPSSFTVWASLRARCAIVSQAIRMMAPAPDHADRFPLVEGQGASDEGKYNPTRAIMRLRTFERFVFVISILESQLDMDCAVVLRCSRREVMIARELALRSLTAAGVSYEEPADPLRWVS
jgi:hypothetical protein